MDEAANRIVFERARRLLPQSVQFHGLDLGPPIGLNRRWRLYRYNAPSDVVKMHTDGACTGSGLDEEGNYVHEGRWQLMINGESYLAQELFNEAIKKIRADGTYQKIQDKYFDFNVYGAE